MLKQLFQAALCVLLLFACNKSGSEEQSVYVGDSLEVILKNRDRGYESNKKAFNILLSRPNDSTTRSQIFDIGNSFYIDRNLNDFKILADAILRKSIEKKDTSDIAKSYRYIAEYYKISNKNDSAYIYFSKAEKLYLKLNDRLNYGKILLKKGIVQYYGNAYLEADLSVTQAYNLLKDSEDKQLVYQALSMIGIIATELKDYDKAIDYHSRALKVVVDNNLDDELNQRATTLNNLGNVYQNIGNNREAIKNFNLALRNTDKLMQMPELYARLLDNLAYSKLQLKDTTNIGNIFQRALKIRDSLDFDSGVVLSNIHLSEFYDALKDTIRSQKYADDALKLSFKTKTPIDRLLSLKQASVVNHKNGPQYYKAYMDLNDSLQQVERKSRDKFARIQLETDEISSQRNKLEEQNRTLLYIFIGTMTIGMLLFVIRTQRAKNRELMLKQAQQKANEDIYNLMISQQNSIEESRSREKKRIAQELHDGVLGRLFGARLNLDSLNRQNSEEAVLKRNDYLTELKNIEQDIREISHDLNREKYVLINNFIAILNNLLEEQRNSFPPELIASIDESIKWDQIENTAKINVYRIIQESLQNINKYASAKMIRIELKRQGDTIRLTVSDDGIGFAVNTKKKGIGVLNMVSRAHEMGGTFDVRSKKGKGTTVIVIFPINN